MASNTAKITLADGTEIDASTGEVVRLRKYVEVPKPSQLQEDRAVSVRKLLADLPAPPQQMNAISVVVAYSLFGLNDADISVASSIPVDIVKSIKRSDAFNAMYEAVAEGIVRSDKDTVHHMLTTASKNAASRIIGFVDDDSPTVAMAAAKDVLDRGGFRPSDVVEHKHSLEGGLTIEFIRRSEEKNIPMIEVNPKGEF